MSLSPDGAMGADTALGVHARRSLTSRVDLYLGYVELPVRGVTAPQRTVFQPPIWELSNRSGVGGAPLFTVLGWVGFGAPGVDTCSRCSSGSDSGASGSDEMITAWTRLQKPMIWIRLIAAGS